MTNACPPRAQLSTLQATRAYPVQRGHSVSPGRRPQIRSAAVLAATFLGQRCRLAPLSLGHSVLQTTHPSTSCPCLCCRADDAGNELRLPAAAGAGSSITVTYASVLERAAPLARGLPAGILPKACKRCVATTGSCSGDFTGFGTPEFC